MTCSSFGTWRATRARSAAVLAAQVGFALAAIPAQAQNLIYNGNFELGPTGFYTEFLLWGAGSGPGLFDIRAYPETWHPFFAPCRDHTGVGNRWMMVVNGSAHPVLWAYQLNVDPATAYRFRFWYVTLYPSNPARILTRIRREAPAPSGTWVDLPEFQFTANTDCIWRNADYVWFSGDTTRVTIILMDQEGRDSGNDFALDDMEFIRLSPANDNCANAITVPCGGSATVDNTSASTAADDPNFECRYPGAEAQGARSTWYKFVATQTAALIDTEGSGVADTLLQVYSDACGSLTTLACDDDSGTGLLSRVSVSGLIVGGTYYIEAANWSSSVAPGNIRVNVMCISPSPGDVDGDGDTDQDDLDVVLFNFGALVPPGTNGDLDGDGDVDQDDLDLVLFFFGQ